jgi:hypothetical protein
MTPVLSIQDLLTVAMETPVRFVISDSLHNRFSFVVAADRSCVPVLMLTLHKQKSMRNRERFALKATPAL